MHWTLTTHSCRLELLIQRTKMNVYIYTYIYILIITLNCGIWVMLGTFQFVHWDVDMFIQNRTSHR